MIHIFPLFFLYMAYTKTETNVYAIFFLQIETTIKLLNNSASVLIISTLIDDKNLPERLN
jgi:hypothetical protein